MDAEHKHTEHPHYDTWKLVVAVVLALLVLVVVFGAGMLAGLEKARFSDHWQENYYPNVLGILGKQPMVLNAHGVIGPVIKLNTNSMVVEDGDGSEKTVLISPATTIREDGNTITFSQVELNDQVVVIGSPNNQGEITASLVRVMDDETQ